MKAYVDEVRKLEERFDGIQAEHVPRAENDIADYLSKRAALKLPVEPGTFVLQLTQPSGKDVAMDADPTTGQPTLAGPRVMVGEPAAPAAE